MATQGLLSIIDSEGNVQIKVVTGSDGYNIPKLKVWCEENPGFNAHDLWHKAKNLFGNESLIVQTSQSDCFADSPFSKPDLDENCLYFKEFHNPNFNPRWELGIADYALIHQVTV